MPADAAAPETPEARHVFEPALSGRSKCRGCARPIAGGELRFGEKLPNPFGGGEMTLWFHPLCAAYKRPEALLHALERAAGVPGQAALERAARHSLEHRRLPRIDGVERAPSGKAKCRSCKQPIDRGAWRIRLVFFEEGRFNPGGTMHLECRKSYFETDDILDHALHFSSDLSDAEKEDLRRALGAA